VSPADATAAGDGIRGDGIRGDGIRGDGTAIGEHPKGHHRHRA
jgi:hypothetical protein